MLAAFLLAGACATQTTRAPEDRALQYLAREVPRWSAEHGCYSCHNNGDGARTLYIAVRLGHAVPPAALEDSTRWLARPETWDSNRGDPRASDKKLARIQFAAALQEALEAGTVRERAPLVRAAELVAELQHPDGSWPIDPSGSLGSPATYGQALATSLARRTLAAAGAGRFERRMAAADRWLRRAAARSVLDASALVLGLDRAQDREALEQTGRCLELLVRGQASDGGWGPYASSPPEPFDTAVALLALASLPATTERAGMILRGRKFLASTQLEDGSWQETTRPPRSESYAQRLSTTAWAAQALLQTRP